MSNSRSAGRRRGNRDALVAGARDALIEVGYAGATAREITRRADTSLAAIGYHFGSTAALLHEVIDQTFLESRAAIAAAITETDGPPEAALGRVGTELDRIFEEHRRLFAVLLEAVALAERTGAIAAGAADGYEADRHAVASMVASLQGGATGDLGLASVLIAVVDGLWIQHLVDPDRAPAPSAVLPLLAPLLRSPSA